MTNMNEPRLLTNQELGIVILLIRKMRQWSQETLAEISGLTPRTIQRVEHGQGCSADSRRALATAFDIEDIEYFNKPMTIPTPEELEQEKVKFDKERLVIKAEAISSGREMAMLAQVTQAHMFSSKEDIPADTDITIAELEDMFTDYRDAHDLYSAKDKMDIYKDFQTKLDKLLSCGVELCQASRKVVINPDRNDDHKPLIFSLVYFLAHRKGDMPEQLAVPREVSFW